ncbi:PHP domain-containing protein, partial [Odoribacter laneus]
MKKIDLHIHTIPSSVSDSHFDFDISKLKEYVSTMGIDGIAITNHNVFDKNQYLTIKAMLVDITVFPGIEVDLCNGHILVITDELDIDDFDKRTNMVTSNIHTATDSLDLPTFESIFTDLSKYLLIPHYDKKPHIPKDVILKLGEHITAGEVNSPKKFIYCRKDKNSLVPVYFSDGRFTSAIHDFQPRQTFIEVGDLSVHALKEALKDRQKVALDGSDKNLIDINTGELKISSGLSVVLGRRS